MISKNSFLPGVLFSILLIGVGSPADAIADDSDIPVLSGSGSPVRFIRADQLSHTVQTAVGKVTDASLQSLQNLNNPTCEASEWELRTVSVGVGIGIDAGLGPVGSIGAFAQIRLLFAPNEDFVTP